MPVRRYSGSFGASGFVISLFALVILLSGCSGLSSEPRTVATLRPRPTAQPTAGPTRVPDVGYPQAALDLVSGAKLFADRCTACHGPQGEGDGEMVRAGSVPQSANFTDPATARNQTPLEWFGTITNGRLDKLMPNWNRALSETERWNVAFYTYTLSYTPEQVAQGQRLVEADAALRGLAEAALARLADRQQMVRVSDAALEAQLVPQDSTLSVEQRRAVLAYVRLKSLGADQPPAAVAAQSTQSITQSATQSVTVTQSVTQPAAPVATEDAAPTEVGAQAATAPADLLGTVSGQIINATTGGSVPPNLAVKLHMFDPANRETTFDSTADESGKFTFKEVPIRADRAYIVTVMYQDRMFGGDFAVGDPTKPDMTTQVRLYELTSDPSVLTITSLITQMNVTEDSLEVAQIMRLINTSDRVFSLDEKLGDKQYASVKLNLPPGAVILGFADRGDRYAVAPDGRTVSDTVPVVPGEQHSIHVLYRIPYNVSGTAVELPISYAVDGQVQVLVGPTSVNAAARFGSNPLQPGQDQAMGSSVFRKFGGPLVAPANQTLRFEVSGRPLAAGSATAAPQSAISRELLIGLLIGLGSGIVVVGAFFMWRERVGRRSAAWQEDDAEDERADDTTEPDLQTRQQQVETLVGQLAALDDEFAQGKLTKKVYDQRRRELKSRLAALMKD